MTSYPVLLTLAVVAACAAAPPPASLDSVRQEPNLEHRSSLALEYALAMSDIAPKAYRDGKSAQLDNALKEVASGAELALESLGKTGKVARKSPKYFKRAEIATRQVIRRLDDLAESMNVDERAAVAQARARVAAVRDNLIEQLMARKPK